MKAIDQLITIIVGTVLLIGTIFLFAALSGTVLYFIYPHIHALFPTAATNGIIAKELGWIDSICITWIFSILLKSTSKSINKSDKK